MTPLVLIHSGNPKRFQSQDVVRFSEMSCEQGRMTKSASRRPMVGPVEDIVTEGDRQLKDLVHKQLKTDIKLTEYVINQI